MTGHRWEKRNHAPVESESGFAPQLFVELEGKRLGGPLMVLEVRGKERLLGLLLTHIDKVGALVQADAEGVRTEGEVKVGQDVGGDGRQQTISVGYQDGQTDHVRMVRVSWTYKQNRQSHNWNHYRQLHYVRVGLELIQRWEVRVDS